MQPGENTLILYLYITKNVEKCIPCRRVMKFLNSLGARYEIKFAEEEQEFFLWLTGGRSVVPVLLNPHNGKIIIGCPTRFSEFVKELQKILQ